MNPVGQIDYRNFLMKENIARLTHTKLAILLLAVTITNTGGLIISYSLSDFSMKCNCQYFFNTVYCFLFAVKKFRGCKSFPSFPEKYLRLQNILPIMAKFERSKLKFRLKTFAVMK